MKKHFLPVLILLCLDCFAQTGKADVVRGNEFYKLSQWDKAEAAYRQALQKEPANQTAMYNLANALQKQKKWDEAVQVLDRLAPSAKENIKPSAYYNQGVAFTKQKELEKSIEAYKQSLRNNPDDAETRENLQKALHELKQQQQQQKQQSSGGGGGMSQKDAEQKLKQLQDKERKLQQKLQQKGQQGNGGAKDW